MYIDPNTGGMLFQALAAAFALLSGIALLFSRQIRAAFARLRRLVRESLQDDEKEGKQVGPAPRSTGGPEGA